METRERRNSRRRFWWRGSGGRRKGRFGPRWRGGDGGGVKFVLIGGGESEGSEGGEAVNSDGIESVGRKGGGGEIIFTFYRR